MPEAEAYLEKVCACIRDKRTRLSVREELRDHLDALAADYIADGLNEEDAYRKAAAEMGNANAVGEELGRIHSFFPLRRFNTALTLLFWGFLLVSFRLDFWYFDEIVRLVGLCLMLTSALLLRRSNSLLTAAFALYLTDFILTIVGNLFDVIPAFPGSSAIGRALLIVGTIIYLVFMFAMSYGVAVFSTGKRARQMKRCGFLYAGNLLCYLLMYLLPAVIALWIIVFVLLLLVILHHIWCVRTDIWRNEREVPMRKVGKPAAAALAVLMALTVAAPTATAAALTNRPATVISYSQADVGTDAATLARVKALEARIKEETGYNKIEGEGYTIDLFRAIFESAFTNIRQSDLLSLESAQSFSDFGLVGHSQFTCLILTAVMSENTAIMLFYYRIDNFLPLPGARQISFDTDSLAVVPNTRRFVSLGGKDGATVEIVPEYERRASGKGVDGVELRLSNDMSDGRGYIMQEFYYGGDAAAVTCNIEVFDQKSFYRAPYNYDNLENAFGDKYDSDVWFKRNTAVKVYLNGR